MIQTDGIDPELPFGKRVGSGHVRLRIRYVAGSHSAVSPTARPVVDRSRSRRRLSPTCENTPAEMVSSRRVQFLARRVHPELGRLGNPSPRKPACST
jgi:hypothetical protein